MNIEKDDDKNALTDDSGSHPGVPTQPPLSLRLLCSLPSSTRTAPGPTAARTAPSSQSVASPQWPPRSGGPPWFPLQQLPRSGSPNTSLALLPESARSKAIGRRSCVVRPASRRARHAASGQAAAALAGERGTQLT